jgi:hypothetical protein
MQSPSLALGGNYMAFIRLDEIVINTTYIVAVELDNETIEGESSVAVLIAAPKFPLIQKADIMPSLHHYEWLEFTGRKATALRDYFSNFNTVVDLCPHSVMHDHTN